MCRELNNTEPSKLVYVISRPYWRKWWCYRHSFMNGNAVLHTARFTYNNKHYNGVAHGVNINVIDVYAPKADKEEE